MPAARAANAAVTATIFDAPSTSQPGFPDFTSESIPNLPNNPSQTLYSVAFDKYALGKSTVDFADDESLYLYSGALAPPDSALATGKNLASVFPADVGESTTVPIPAAVWLLGTGLLGFIAVARPRRLIAKNPPQAFHATAQRRPHGEVVKSRERARTSEYRWYAAYSSWPGELC
jgi:hypothetical protein